MPEVTTTAISTLFQYQEWKGELTGITQGKAERGAIAARSGDGRQAKLARGGVEEGAVVRVSPQWVVGTGRGTCMLDKGMHC